MLLPDFDYHRPRSLAELFTLVEQIKDLGEDYRFYAGGTDVMPELKMMGFGPRNLISCGAIEGLDGMQVDDKEGVLRIGAMTKLADLTKNPLILKHHPVIAQVAKKIASPQIRQQGSIGGNLVVNTRCVYYNQPVIKRATHGECLKSGGGVCHMIKNSATCKARFVSDLAPALLLLGAKLKIAGAERSREVDLKYFYRADGIDRNSLQPGELVLSVQVPLQAPQKVGYLKLRVRDAIDFPSMGTGVGLYPTEAGDDLKVVVTGMDTWPVMIEVKRSDFASQDDMVAEASQMAMGAVTPLKQDFFPTRYRRQMIGVFIRRLVEDLGG